MLRCARPSLNRLLAFQRFYSSKKDDGSHSTKQPAILQRHTRQKSLEEVFGEAQDRSPIQTLVNRNEIMEISGVPEEHQYERRARIFRPARNAEQAGYNNTSVWKIELDMQSRWENPCIGYSSNSDPLSNISMQLNFPSAQDAINFCEKNKWPYTVEKEHDREIKPKQYGSNFHWSKRSRVSTK